MKKILLTFFIATSLFAQTPLNVVKLGALNPRPTQDYSDIWGYTDPQGREYAIIGCYSGTSIINITNAAQPVEVAFIPGPSSIWRDIKTHLHYAYITTEGTGTGKGLQIVDLSNLPTSATLVNTITTWFNSAHNIHIDNGYAYVIGTNSGGGMHILNLSNPTNPTRTAYYTTSGYIHDVYVYNDTVYAASEDTYDVVNVTNKANPVRVSASIALPGIYGHSGWLTEDKRYFIGCEEFDVRDVTVWDLQDRTSWNLVVPQWQMPTTTPVHNLFVKGNYAHISYYKEGYVVLDVSNPLSPQLVGHYDTYPSSSGTYEGAWGCYPYFASGKVIVSDISTGLYIFDFLLDNNQTPVELSSFSFNTVGPFVNLKWQTATELNNSGFEVQKSFDNSNWMDIGFVKGYGTTTEKKIYNFVDRDPITQSTFYRLVQVDFDGTKNFYDPIEVKESDLPSAIVEYNLEQNYPNPFNPSTKIKFTIPNDEIVSLKIYDVLGNEMVELVNEKMNAGAHEVEFNGSGLSSGVYYYKLISGNFVDTKKLILTK